MYIDIVTAIDRYAYVAADVDVAAHVYAYMKQRCVYIYV